MHKFGVTGCEAVSNEKIPSLAWIINSWSGWTNYYWNTNCHSPLTEVRCGGSEHGDGHVIQYKTWNFFSYFNRMTTSIDLCKCSVQYITYYIKKNSYLVMWQKHTSWHFTSSTVFNWLLMPESSTYTIFSKHGDGAHNKTKRLLFSETSTHYFISHQSNFTTSLNLCTFYGFKFLLSSLY